MNESGAGISYWFMQNTERKYTDYRLLPTLTSLREVEFLSLLVCFDEQWQHYYRYHDLHGRERKAGKYSEHRSMSLKGSADKLFFVLYYLKHNHLQSSHGYTFNMSQGKVSQWLKTLLPLLEKSLGKMKLLPARTSEHLYLSLQVLAGQVLYMDATERPVPRSVDWERQKQEYSGKKGMHTNKNLLIANERKQILYLSATVAGSMRDKALADEMELSFCSQQGLLLDSGFQGYDPEGIQLCLPVKKPRKKELSEFDKMYNRLLASLRVKAEHAIGEVKRCRIVKDKIRLGKDNVKDAVMLIACGLQNLRISYRNLS